MIEYKTVSLANQVYEVLLHDIINGKYKKGQIITESGLSKELGVSRTPIREAILRLSQERLVKDRQMGSEVIGISKKDVEDMLNVKRLLEPEIAEGLAENLSEKGMEKLGEIVDKQEYYSQKNDYEKVMILDTEFHTVLYGESGSNVYSQILEQTHKKLLRVRLSSLRNEKRINQSTEEHRELFDILKTGDAVRIRKQLMKHLENSRENILKGISQWD